MLGNLPLSITILFHCLDDRIPPLPQVHLYFRTEEHLQRRPVRVPLAPRNLRNILVLFEMIDELIDEAFLSQESLSPYLGPDGILPDPPMNELSILLHCLTPLPAAAELA